MAIVFPEYGSILAGRYVIEGVLGEGSCGTVYLAAQPALAREVAIKVVHAMHANELAAEAVAAARVGSRGCAAVHDVGVAPNGGFYMVMERVHGRQLSQIVDEEPLPVPRALSIAQQLVAMLEAAHDARVVHGDVRSANILVDETADGDRVTLIDYGHATCDAARPANGVTSDIRAAGIVLYEMVTGHTVIAGPDQRILPMAVRRPDLEIPAALDYAVMRALEPDPQRRFPTAEAMRRSLKTIDCRRVLPSYHRSTPIPTLPTAEGSGASRVPAATAKSALRTMPRR